MTNMIDAESVNDLLEILKSLDQELLEMSVSLETHQLMREDITRRLQQAIGRDEAECICGSGD